MDEQKERSPSQTLIECMETFGVEEPSGVLVIWKTKDAVSWMSDSSMRLTEAIGLSIAAADTFRDLYRSQKK